MILKALKYFLPVFILTLLAQSCHVGRYFYWNFADVRDYKKFPSVPVDKSDTPFHFQTGGEQRRIELPEKYQKKDKPQNLAKFLDDHKTLAFLVIRNDTILMEKYFSGYDESSVIPSFSVSKVFVSALTGTAIDEEAIGSVNDPVTNYLPELLNNDPRFADITIEHLLNMRSGIRFNEGYANPFADMAKYYYGRHLKKYISKLRIERPPGEVYKYISVNTLLLAMIIENATGRQLNEYLSEKIWQPLGMEFDATWSTDRAKDGQIKAFCCINARARDFAKFGRLYVNGGKWNGKQVVPEDWVDKSLFIANDSRDSQGYPYHYQWRVLKNGSAFAKGVLGQYIYIHPEKELIIVRMGKKSAGVVWAEFFEEVSKTL